MTSTNDKYKWHVVWGTRRKPVTEVQEQNENVDIRSGYRERG